MILAPLVRGRRGAHRDVMEAIQKAGFVRARIDGVTYPLDEIPPLAPQKMHDIEAVVDRIVIREGIDARLGESVRLAARHGDGVVRRRVSDSRGEGASRRRMQLAGAAAQHALRLPALRHEHRRNRAADVQLQQPVRCVPDVSWVGSDRRGAGERGSGEHERHVRLELLDSQLHRSRRCLAPIAAARGCGPKRAPAAWAAWRFTRSRRSR